MENNREKFVVKPKPVFGEMLDEYHLSEEQLKYYKDNGFLVIKGLIDFTSLYSYKQRFLQIAKGFVPRGAMTVMRDPTLLGTKLNPEDYVNKIQEIPYDDVFVQYALHPRLYHILTQLVGDDITAIHSMFINKPPGTGRHPPHQDLYYFPYRPADKIVASWTAVDHVTTDNGCLYVVPGSHKAQIIYEHGYPKGENTKLYHGIVAEDQVAPESSRIHLEMSPGDTVFFHPCLVHGSRPNVSKNYRKAITFHFMHSSCECVDVRGTVQQVAVDEVESQAKRRGYELSFIDVWEMKKRHITGLLKPKSRL